MKSLLALIFISLLISFSFNIHGQVESTDSTLRLIEKNDGINLDSVKQASKDSVRAIMLIRAYRIRGHLTANLDPLSIHKEEEHPELKPETYGFEKKDYNRK